MDDRNIGLCQTYIGYDDARVSVPVASGEGHGFVIVWTAGTVSKDVELGTAWVELCASDAGAEVQRDDLVADHVVPRSDVGGDLDVNGAAVH